MIHPFIRILPFIQYDYMDLYALTMEIWLPYIKKKKEKGIKHVQYHST